MRRDAALQAVRSRLAEAGLAEAALEARLLVGAAAGIGPLQLLLSPESPLSGQEAEALAAMTARRLAREPLSRILGEKEFWSLPFEVTAETLVPRPETETLVEAALARIRDRSAPLRLLDLGTGAGCILVALLHELPRATGVGVDRSLPALRTARRNAARNGVGARAAFLLSDWAAAVSGRFDLVLSNPPYIPAAEIAGLAPEVAAHDPRAALDGGPDGLAPYRAILPDLPRLLPPDGVALLEVGPGQVEALAPIAAGNGLLVEAVREDLEGRARAVVLSRGPGRDEVAALATVDGPRS